MITPFADDVNDLFRNAGAFLHVSRAEGLSYALMEAAYAGLPVVCSDIPENMELSACKSITFVKSEDVGSIVEGMRKVMDAGFQVRPEDLAQTRAVIDQKYSLATWCGRVMNEYFRENGGKRADFGHRADL